MIWEIAIGIVLGVILLNCLPLILAGGIFLLGIAVIVAVGIAAIALFNNDPGVALFIIFMTFVVWAASRKTPAKKQSVVSTSNNLLQTVSPPKDAPKDAFEDEIETQRKQAEIEIKKAAEERKQELDEKYSADIKLKNELATFAKKQKLDVALVAVWEAIKYYPSWSKRDDFSQHQVVAGNNWAEEKIKENNQEFQSISFKYNDVPFSIRYRESPSYMDTGYYVELMLFENNELVFHISGSKDFTDWGSQISAGLIQALKKKGTWAKFLLEAWQSVQIGKQKSETSLQYYGADKIKENFQK